MSEGPRTTTVGNAGGTPISHDLTHIDPTPVKVLLSANYTTSYPDAYPTPPWSTGAEVKTGAQGKQNKTILSGTKITLIAGEANALIAAGKATLTT